MVMLTLVVYIQILIEWRCPVYPDSILNGLVLRIVIYDANSEAHPHACQNLPRVMTSGVLPSVSSIGWILNP
jgi:hypothetical protein